MLYKDIVKRRLSLLLDDVQKEYSADRFTKAELIELGNTIRVTLVSKTGNKVTFEFNTLTQDWNIESGQYRDTGFDNLIKKLTNDTLFYDNLSPLNYLYDTNFLIYTNEDRLPGHAYRASNKYEVEQEIQTLKDYHFIKKNDKVIIKNCNTGQEVELIV